VFQQRKCISSEGKTARKFELSSFHVIGVGGGVREVVMNGLDKDLRGEYLHL